MAQRLVETRVFRVGVPNLLVRGATIGSRFLLTIYLAREIGAHGLGEYGLMTASLGIATFLVGMEYHAVNGRDLLAANPLQRAVLIRDQAIFHGITYVVLLPMLLVLFAQALLPWHLVGWFYGLLVIEHAGHEAMRVFVVLYRPVLANTLLFLRTGSWVLVILVLALVAPSYRTLTTIWVAWIIGGLASLAIAAYALRDMGWRKAIRRPVAWPRMWGRFRNALPFMASAVAVLLMDYTDRYFIVRFHGEAAVGVYTLFAAMAGIVAAAVSDGVVRILFPRLVASFQRADYVEYGIVLRRMAFGIGAMALGAAIAAAIAVYPVLTLTARAVYAEALPVYWVLLGAVVAGALAEIPHYALYARRRDIDILASTLTSLLTLVAFNAWLVPDHGLMGAAVALLVGRSVLGITKLGFWMARA